VSFPAERRNTARGEGNPGRKYHHSDAHLGPLPSCSLSLAFAGDDMSMPM